VTHRGVVCEEKKVGRTTNMELSKSRGGVAGKEETNHQKRKTGENAGTGNDGRRGPGAGSNMKKKMKVGKKQGTTEETRIFKLGGGETRIGAGS